MMGSSPAIANGMVYAFDGGEFYGVDAATSKVKCSQDVQGWQGPFAVSSGIAVTLDYDHTRHTGRPTAIDTSTCRKLWQGEELPLLPYHYNNIVASEDSVYLAGNAQIVALNLTDGRTRWATQNEAEKYGLALANGILYVTGGGPLMALDARTGTIVWQSGVSAGSSEPVIANGVVYVERRLHLTNGPEVLALDARTGVNLWQWQPPNSAEIASIVVANGRLYVGYTQTAGRQSSTTIVVFKGNK